MGIIEYVNVLCKSVCICLFDTDSLALLSGKPQGKVLYCTCSVLYAFDLIDLKLNNWVEKMVPPYIGRV